MLGNAGISLLSLDVARGELRWILDYTRTVSAEILWS